MRFLHLPSNEIADFPEMDIPGLFWYTRPDLPNGAELTLGQLAYLDFIPDRGEVANFNRRELWKAINVADYGHLNS
jgi:hypothetical protein